MKRLFALTLLLAAAAALAPHPAIAGLALGPRAGSSDGEFFLGGQMELPATFGVLSLVPSADFGVGSDAPSVANGDLRLDLIPLPETGLRFYGQAGPTMILEGDFELGLSVGLGLVVPMRDGRRYNIEYRWGLGDAPDHKLAVSILFGL